MQFWTIHRRNFFMRDLSKTDLGEKLGKPRYSVERDGRALSTTVGSFFFFADSVKTHLSFKAKLEKGTDHATQMLSLSYQAGTGSFQHIYLQVQLKKGNLFWWMWTECLCQNFSLSKYCKAV